MQVRGDTKHSIVSAMILMACASSLFPASDIIAKALAYGEISLEEKSAD